MSWNSISTALLMHHWFVRLRCKMGSSVLCYDIGLGLGKLAPTFKFIETLDGFRSWCLFPQAFNIHTLPSVLYSRVTQPSYFFLYHLSCFFLLLVVGSLSAESDQNSNQMDCKIRMSLRCLDSRTGSGWGSHAVASPYLPISCLHSHMGPFISPSHCCPAVSALWFMWLETWPQHVPDFTTPVMSERLVWLPLSQIQKSQVRHSLQDQLTMAKRLGN